MGDFVLLNDIGKEFAHGLDTTNEWIMLYFNKKAADYFTGGSNGCVKEKQKFRTGRFDNRLSDSAILATWNFLKCRDRHRLGKLYGCGNLRIIDDSLRHYILVKLDF